MDDERDFKQKIDKAAKNYRLLQRADAFQKFRKSVKQQLSYLKAAILESLTGVIPSVLPPLSPYTISYYRRSSRPIFKTKVSQNGELNPHLTYQSLFALAGIQEIHFSNYQQIVKEFQTDLKKYLSLPYPQIKEMAIIAAGNKILGKQSDIQSIASQDPRQIWVLINHIYERKIPSNYLFKYLKQNNEIVFCSLFEMSNSNDDQIIELIMKNEEVLQVIIENLRNYNLQIRKYCLRIIGNILAEKDEYIEILEKYQILEHFYEILNESDKQLKKDVCWALSNFAVERNPATALINSQGGKLIAKLESLLFNQIDDKIRIQLCHIFSCLTAFAQKNLVFGLICRGRVLEVCQEYLKADDQDLIHVTLYLVSKIFQLGDYLAGEEGNYFVGIVKKSNLKNKILEKTYYTENSEISMLSSELEQKLDDY